MPVNNPNSVPEFSATGGQPTQKPIAQVMAERQAQQAAVAQVQAAGDKVAEVEKSDAEIFMYVVQDLNYCGLDPTEANAERAMQILSAHQAQRQATDPSYVLGQDPEETTETLSDLVLGELKDQAGAVEKGAEDPERAAAIKAAYTGDWQRFGTDPSLDDQMCERLCQYEAENRVVQPDYDLTTDRNRRRAERQVEKWLEELAQAQTIAAKTDEVEDRTDIAEDRTDTALDEESEEADFAEFQAELKESPEWQGLSTVAKLQRLLNEPRVPEEYKARLVGLLRIHSIASRNEADKAIVTASFERIDVFNPPTAQSFARSFIFDSPDSQIKTGVSEDTQNAIAAELGIVRDQFDVRTGGDIRDIYANGVGTETYRDENGEIQTRRVPLAPGEDVEIRDGQFLGLDNQGDPVMKIVGEHTYISDLPENPTAEDMTKYAITTQWIGKLNDSNMAEIFFPHSVMERGGGHIQLNMPDDFNRAQKLSQMFFGAMAGYNGELISQPDLDRIPYLLQFQNEKGDAVIGDVNPEQMLADYRRQGVLNKDNTLNWDRFATMIEANRNGLFFSEERYGENAQSEAS